MRACPSGKPGQASLRNHPLLVLVSDPQGCCGVGCAPGQDQGLRQDGLKPARVGMVAQRDISPNADLVSNPLMRASITLLMVGSRFFVQDAG